MWGVLLAAAGLELAILGGIVLWLYLDGYWRD